MSEPRIPHRRLAPLLLLASLACWPTPRASARPVRPTAADCAEYAQRAALIANRARASGQPTAAARLAALGEAQTALKCIKHRRLVPGSFWMSVGVSGGYHAIAVGGRPSDVGSFADTLLLSVIPAFHWDFSAAFGLVIGIPLDVLLLGDNTGLRLGGQAQISWAGSHWFLRGGVGFHGPLIPFEVTLRKGDKPMRKTAVEVEGLVAIGYELWVSDDSTMAFSVGGRLGTDMSVVVNIEWRPSLQPGRLPVY